METYEIEVLIDGVPTYIVDVPTSQGPDAACRRAKIAVASQHPRTDLSLITTKVKETP